MSRWRAELDDLVARRGKALVGYAYIVCGNAHDADDLVQEALIKVYSRLMRPRGVEPTVIPLESEDGPTHPEAYVRRAILSLYLDGYRRRSRWNQRVHLLHDDVPPTGPASGASVRADVAVALSRLSPQQRACVVLRFYEDLTVAQISAALGIAEGTIKRHLSEATARLRIVLAADHNPTPRALNGETR